MIKWPSDEEFAKMSEQERDDLLDKILRQNREKDSYKILCSDQLYKRRKRETGLFDNQLDW